MSLFAQKRGMSLSAVVLLAVGLVWLSGCGDDRGTNPGGGGGGYGTFTDARNGREYKVAAIGGQLWMTENLNISTADSWCYNNSSDSCAKYGRLYTWAAARTACPDEWRLPSRQDWERLAESVGGRRDPNFKVSLNSGNDYGITDKWIDAAVKLKAKRGWNWNADDNVSGNGTDNIGFSALPGGYRYDLTGSFDYAGYGGFWWTATEYGGGHAYMWKVYNSILDELYNRKSYGFSVRCVKDEDAPPIPATYTVTVSSAGTGVSDSGNYAAGATVTISAGTAPTGQQFKNWTTTSKGVIFADSTKATTTFIMPKNAVTVTAVFEQAGTTIPPGGGGDDLDPPDDMVYVQGGTFMMGCTAEQGNDCLADEKPAHSVTVDDFYIGKYEVTQKLWREVMGSLPAKIKSPYVIQDDHPIYFVSWLDVQDFISALNKKSGGKYRLPTEAEWEYAARGGNKSAGYKFAGGNNIGEVGWYGLGGNAGNKVHPVGVKLPNELGIYDMAGNINEVVSDWYGSDYYGSSPLINPTGPSTGTEHSIRGGGWDLAVSRCRVTKRDRVAPDLDGYAIGFRLALTTAKRPNVTPPDTAVTPPDTAYQNGLLEGLPFRLGEIPTGAENLLQYVDMGSTIISGGSVILTIRSPVGLKYLYISVAGDRELGYYVLDLSRETPESANGLYVYKPTLLISQNLTGGDMLLIKLGGVSADNRTSSTTDKYVQTMEVGSGNLQVSLSWNNDDDLDLHIVTPKGEIYYDNKIAGNGELDLDANVGCGGKSNENIYFDGTLDDGLYFVWVELFTKCGEAGADYNVAASADGRPFSFSGDSQSERGRFRNGDNDHTEAPIGVITVKNGAIVKTDYNNPDVVDFMAKRSMQYGLSKKKK